MMHARAKLALLLALPGCIAVAGCSNSNSSSSSAAIPANLTTGLQEVVAQGQAYASVPTDPATLKVAAQITELEQDREVQLGSASMLLASETDPKYSHNAAMLEAARQRALALAASDLTQIQKLQQANVPGQSALAADGGADEVIASLIAQTFSSRAQTILTNASKGANGPTSGQISNFLQQVAIVMGDDGAGGHNVAARLIAHDILSDAGLSTYDAGAP